MLGLTGAAIALGMGFMYYLVSSNKSYFGYAILPIASAIIAAAVGLLFTGLGQAETIYAWVITVVIGIVTAPLMGKFLVKSRKAADERALQGS